MGFGLFCSRKEEMPPYSFGKSDYSRQDSYSSVSSADDEKDEDAEYEACYEIDFWHLKKLPNGAIVFKIRDEDLEVVGFAVASAIDAFDIFGTNFGEITKKDLNYLKEQLRNFCKVYYPPKNTGESTNSSGVSTDTP